VTAYVVPIDFFATEPPRDFWAERGYDWYSGL